MNLIRKHPITSFFILTLAWSCGIWILLIPQIQNMLNINLNNQLAWAGLLGPGLMAVLISATINGKQEIIQLFKPLLKWNVPYIYYVFIFGGCLLFYAAASWITVSLNTEFEIPSFSWLLNNVEGPFFGAHGIWILIQTIIIYTLCEELGWRGFALPRMTKTINTFFCAIIIGFFWTIWHLPLIYLNGSSLNLTSSLFYFLHIESFSIIYAWLYYKTNKSLLMCGLFHGMTNFISMFFPAVASTIGQGPNGITITMELLVALLMVPYLINHQRNVNKKSSTVIPEI